MKEKLLRDAWNFFDYILDYHEGTDFVEVIGSRGGDICCYRFYESGLVTER